jgi:predicted lipid-binding transport protein (Tim44 family)
MEPMINSASEACPTCGSPLLAATAPCERCQAPAAPPQQPEAGEASLSESLIGSLLGGIVVLGGLFFVVASFLALAAILFGGGD